MKCQDCGLEKPDVKMQTDPFSEEIHGDDTEYPLCDDCVYQSAMDV